MFTRLVVRLVARVVLVDDREIATGDGCWVSDRRRDDSRLDGRGRVSGRRGRREFKYLGNQWLLFMHSVQYLFYSVIVRTIDWTVRGHLPIHLLPIDLLLTSLLLRTI